MKLNPYLILYTKPISKWINDIGAKNHIITLLLLLSRFSHVRLCAAPETAAHQGPPSMGFSRQEYWSGLPLPSLAAITGTNTPVYHIPLYLPTEKGEALYCNVHTTYFNCV